MSTPRIKENTSVSGIESLDIDLSSHYLRLDHFGRLIFDQCPTDQDHLLHPLSTDGERSTCRHSLANFVPAHMFQRKGRWRVSLTFEEDK